MRDANGRKIVDEKLDAKDDDLIERRTGARFAVRLKLGHVLWVHVFV